MKTPQFKKYEFFLEREALSKVTSCTAQIKRDFPCWFQKFDQTPEMASRNEIVHLMHSAPNQFALGLMFGKFIMHQELSAVTKKAWM